MIVYHVHRMAWLSVRTILHMLIRIIGKRSNMNCNIYNPIYTEKMSPVYICQNDKPMTSLALSTAHQVKTNLCQPHNLKGCHIFVINLPKTSHPQFLFYVVDGRRVPI